MLADATGPVLVLLGIIFQDAIAEPLHWPRYLSILFWILLVVAFPVFDRFARRGWKGWDRLRRRRLHVANFEDFWLQNVGNERPYSLALIYFDRDHSRWVYWGRGYGSDFTPRAEWETYAIHYDPESRDWYFAGRGFLLETAGGVDRPRRNTFEVVPILRLPSSRGAAEIEGRVADFDFAGNEDDAKEDRVFTIKLNRGSPILGAVPAVHEIKAIQPFQAKELFRRLNRLLPDAGPVVS